MRCVSKCFMGRSFKVYLLLLVGIVLGFGVSTIVQVSTEAARQQAGAASRGKKEVPLQHVTVRQESPQVAAEEDVRSLELSDYDYNHRGLGEDMEPAPQGGEKRAPSRFPSLAVPKPRILSAKEQEDGLGSQRNSDSVPSRLLQELPSRQSMLVGVITSVSKLMTQTLAIQGTWGPRAPEVIFFVGEVSSIPHLPPKMKIVQLEGVEDGERGRELKEAHAIKHMADQYLDTVDWFLVVGDETYLRPAALEKKLSSIDARYQIYMGRPGAGMDQQGVGKGSLCHREPGVVYSRAMMESLRQYLPTCWPGGQEGGATIHDCIISMQVRCTQAHEVRYRCVWVWLCRHML